MLTPKQHQSVSGSGSLGSRGLRNGAGLFIKGFLLSLLGVPQVPWLLTLPLMLPTCKTNINFTPVQTITEADVSHTYSGAC